MRPADRPEVCVREPRVSPAPASRPRPLGRLGPLPWRAAAFLLVSAALVLPLRAEDEAGPPAPRRVRGGPPPASPTTPPRGPEARESMWAAPTAEDWARPCLLTWQRSWEDALAVSRETGKPILICINMDGEIASEHYAGVRYRSPEIAELYQPYVLVIGSVYRHTPRDHDDQGRRIPCPRFGTVTCGEHIALESAVYEIFLDGVRIAPRHIAVDAAGNELYDVYYANDTASVFETVRKGLEGLPPPLPERSRSDRPLLERVASREVRDREAVERAYAEGDAAQRARLLEAAVARPDAAATDLLRLALFGLDAELARRARQALARTTDPAAVPLLSEALGTPLPEADRAALVAALERLGGTSALARWLAGVHQGLAAPSKVVDPGAWDPAGAAYGAVPPGLADQGLLAAIEERARRLEVQPEDGALRLELAEATLALALEAPAQHETNARLARMAMTHLLAEARRQAEEAARFGAAGWRLDAVKALAAYYAGDLEAAYPLAEQAMQALPPGDPGWTSMAVVTVFAESRWKALKAAVKESRPWSPEWLTDLDAAYSVLLQHPLGTDGQVLWHFDLLDWIGARRRADRVLSRGLERFPESPALHARWRERLLARAGPAGLLAAYRGLLDERGDAARLGPFAGLAAIEAAEQHRRAGARDPALEAYAQAVAWYDEAVRADARHGAGAARAVALAWAGRARVAYELGRTTEALDAVLASFERSPDSAGTRDGMGITPGETAQMLRQRLVEQGPPEALARLDAALARLDPELLRFDRE